MDSTTNPDVSSAFSPLGVLVVISAVKHLVFAAAAKLARRQQMVVGHVTRLVVYPVKSMWGIDVSSAECNFAGLRSDCNSRLALRDRTWMVTTTSYNFVTARQLPKMTTIVPSFHGNRQLQLSAPETDVLIVDIDAVLFEKRTPVKAKVWGETIDAFDCGDQAVTWLDSYLRREPPADDVTSSKVTSPAYRLIYHQPDHFDMRRCDQGQTRWNKKAKPQDQVAFADAFPFMLMNESSVEELNVRLTSSALLPVTMDHFRPNIVVASSPAFGEDDWSELFIGDASFFNVKPCTRCVLTTVIPELGEKRKDNEPLVTLRRYRLLDPEFGNSPCLGINLVMNRPGTIRVGDVVRATRVPQ